MIGRRGRRRRAEGTRPGVLGPALRARSSDPYLHTGVVVVVVVVSIYFKAY